MQKSSYHPKWQRNKEAPGIIGGHNIPATIVPFFIGNMNFTITDIIPEQNITVRSLKKSSPLSLKRPMICRCGIYTIISRFEILTISGEKIRACLVKH